MSFTSSRFISLSISRYRAKARLPSVCPDRDATRFGSFTFLYRLPMNVFLAVWLVAISQIGFCIGSRVLLSTLQQE